MYHGIRKNMRELKQNKLFTLSDLHEKSDTM